MRVVNTSRLQQKRSDQTDNPRGDARDVDVLPPQPSGYVDFYGFHQAAGGWFFGSWLAGRWSDTDQPDITARFEVGEASGPGAASFFHRADLDEGAFGLIVFVPMSGTTHGPLQSMEIRVAGNVGWLCPADSINPLDQATLTQRVKTILAHADPSAGRTQLTDLLLRHAFTGVDTLPTLADFIRVGIDAAIVCPPGAIVLAGWLLAEPDTVRAIRLRGGSAVTAVLLEQAIRIDRPDVVTAFHDSGLTDRRCGFLAYVTGVGAERETLYLEIETVRGETGFVPLPAARQRGMTAIRRLLALFEVRYGELDHAFDAVIGPAVGALNQARLAQSPDIAVTDFGVVDSTPLYSIIVPLYGNIDLMEYQIAFLSRQDCAGHEFIYVLDDPDQDRQTRQLAESLHERFRLPFRLVTLDRNVGYAPANNIGLKLARAPTVCFMNSDVFPGTEGWMPRLTARLDNDPTLGAVGPLLLFEDGSVQHQGIVFEAVPQFANWMFPHHVRKGWRPETQGGLRPCQAITAACLVMRTHLARDLDGFDDAFIIGDFEDTDLCLRIANRGLTCAVDHDVQLFHLERRSQAASTVPWRMNLTLYNAWLHQRRWFPATGMPHWVAENTAIRAQSAPNPRLRSVPR